MTNTTNPAGKFERKAHLRWVPLAAMRVSSAAQRDLKQARVDSMFANLDLEQIGVLTVSERGDHYYIMDGQHRYAVLAKFFNEDLSTKVQCWVYTGLTEEDEAEVFLKLNDVLAVNAFAKFRVGVAAGRPVESDVDRIVRANGCVVSQDKVPGAIGAVGTLVKIYKRDGASVLARTVGIVNVAYGDTGLDGPVLGGVGSMLARYNGAVDDARLVEQLRKVANGARGLMWSAHPLREKFGGTLEQAVAAAVVEVYNRGLAGASAKRLRSWWKEAA